MSWVNKIQNNRFSIVCGDGKEYFPLFKTGERSKEFNTTTFDFIDVSGSLVERKKPKSGKFPLTFWFQGDDNVEQSEAFEKSAEDNRPWTVNHVLYGTIKGQPVSISRNDVNFNITEITVDFWESISADYPTSNFSVKDNTYEKKQSVFASSEIAYSSKDVFKTVDIQKNKDAINKIASKLSKLQTNDTFAEYSNKVNKAVKASDNLINDSQNAISTAQDTLNMPSELVETVQNRINAYVGAFESIISTLESVPDKLFFQSMGGAIIGAICENSTIYEFGKDYTTIVEVEGVATQILSLYEQYLTIVDNASTSNYNLTDNFQPDPVMQSDLNSLVMYTIGNIYNLAFEAKQERIIYTDKVTNLILLTYRYLGLDASDENIETFRKINDIKLNELFRIKKGRKIKYYI